MQYVFEAPLMPANPARHAPQVAATVEQGERLIMRQFGAPEQSALFTAAMLAETACLSNCGSAVL